MYNVHVHVWLFAIPSCSDAPYELPADEDINVSLVIQSFHGCVYNYTTYILPPIYIGGI